jgi:hypothetical protein
MLGVCLDRGVRLLILRLELIWEFERDDFLKNFPMRRLNAYLLLVLECILDFFL